MSDRAQAQAENEGQVTLTLDVTREFNIPVSVLDDAGADEAELEERAKDYFWNYWREFLANEAPPGKAEIEVEDAEVNKAVERAGDTCKEEA